MAFLLFRPGKQMVRLSSWAAKVKPQLPRVLTSVNKNNCFSTDSSPSSGGMTQESNPKKDDAADMRRMPTPTEYFGLKFLNEMLNNNNKPVPPPEDPDFDKFLDDLGEKLEHMAMMYSMSKTEDQSKKNPRGYTPEEMKAISDFNYALASGSSDYTTKLLPAFFKLKGDSFYFTLDTNGLYLTVNVSGLPKEDLVVWVDRLIVLVESTDKVAPDQKVRTAVLMPRDYKYDPVKVTGTIMEDGQLKISFPVSKEGGDPKDNTFKVNLV